VELKKLCGLHRKAALAIMDDKSNAEDRADQLVEALRHIICCAVLVEMPEADLLDIARRYAIK
jgi:hypothetical protein